MPAANADSMHKGLTRLRVELVSMAATCSPRQGLLAGRDLGPILAGRCLCARSAAALGPPAPGLSHFAVCPLDGLRPEEVPCAQSVFLTTEVALRQESTVLCSLASLLDSPDRLSEG